MDYYAPIKRIEALTHATAWMNCENSTFSERSQVHGIIWFCLYEILRKGKSRKTEGTLVVAKEEDGE